MLDHGTSQDVGMKNQEKVESGIDFEGGDYICHSRSLDLKMTQK